MICQCESAFVQNYIWIKRGLYHSFNCVKSVFNLFWRWDIQYFGNERRPLIILQTHWFEELNHCAGLSTYIVDSMWLDRIPRNLMAAFVHSDRFNGYIDKNLLLFYHNYLRQMTFYVNKAALPNRLIEVDFKSRVTDVYKRLEERRRKLSL